MFYENVSCEKFNMHTGKIKIVSSLVYCLLILFCLWSETEKESVPLVNLYNSVISCQHSTCFPDFSFQPFLGLTGCMKARTSTSQKTTSCCVPSALSNASNAVSMALGFASDMSWRTNRHLSDSVPLWQSTTACSAPMQFQSLSRESEFISIIFHLFVLRKVTEIPWLLYFGNFSGTADNNISQTWVTLQNFGLG